VGFTPTLGQSGVATLNVQLYWSKKEGRARVKVKWTTITLPTFEGGFGFINLATQANTFLMHLLLKGLTLGDKPWKHFIRW
jgi:hypothetical protein